MPSKMQMINFFKKILQHFLILIFIILLTACSQKPDAYDSQGNAITINDYKGKWIIINYWATWCEPCYAEMPALNKIYQDNNDKVVVLGVSYDQLPKTEIQKTIQKMKIHYPMLTSFPIKKYGVKQVSVLPTSFIINPHGKLIKVLVGPQSAQQFSKIIGVQHLKKIKMSIT